MPCVTSTLSFIESLVFAAGPKITATFDDVYMCSRPRLRSGKILSSGVLLLGLTHGRIYLFWQTKCDSKVTLSMNKLQLIFKIRVFWQRLWCTLLKIRKYTVRRYSISFHSCSVRMKLISRSYSHILNFWRRIEVIEWYCAAFMHALVEETIKDTRIKIRIKNAKL